MSILPNLIAVRRAAFVTSVFAVGCSSNDEASEADGTSTTAPTGPQPGAPDEHCALDPDRVYLIESPQETIAYTRLTDLEDPTILCAFHQGFRDRIRLDPLDASLLTLRGDHVWRVNQDWMQLNGPMSELWVPAFEGEDNDEDLGRIMQSPTIVCWDDPYVLLTDDTTVYASCGGPWLNAPEVEGVYGHYLIVGLVNERKIFKGMPFMMGGYSADDPEDDEGLQPIPIPAGVDAIEHLAVRPVAGALIAAVQVSRAGTITTEQARVDVNGVTLTGTYAHDVGEAGIAQMDYALAADGTLFGMEILTGIDLDIPQRVVRMTLDEAPEVILTTTFYAEDRPPRLVAVGAGGPTPEPY